MAYLFQVAAHVASEWALTARNRRPHYSKWLADIATEEQPSAQAMRDECRTLVARALGELPARAREVLRLRYRDGLTNGEIAIHLKVHPQTIKRDLLDSYSRLRLDLDPELLMDFNRVDPYGGGCREVVEHSGAALQHWPAVSDSAM